jgi:hypothetical protein
VQVSLLKVQERRWYIDEIEQKDKRRTTQKNLHMYHYDKKKLPREKRTKINYLSLI